jgi:2-polyprenyl-3-methyl-5-hydroxy-6-metoxy-1,4-benzoquinol methylase
VVIDIEDPSAELGRRFDLLMAVDVIEHLLNPDALLRFLYLHAHTRSVVVLSTPERDLRRGPGDCGPPANPAHVREWNGTELQAYLRSTGLFDVLSHQVVDMLPGMRTCQVVVCRPRGV